MMDSRSQQAAPTRRRERRRARAGSVHGRPERSPNLASVFEAEEGPLLRFAFGMIGRREVAEDLVQEAFLRLHKHWDEVENHRAWLFRCVRNLALNHIRDHKRELGEEAGRGAAAKTVAPDLAVGRMEAAGTLRMLVAELPAMDRQLVELKYEQELKYREISERTGLSVGNVGYRLHHVLKGLAEALRRAGVEKPGA
jgi:RNA polymerase sigma-70 factor (ECF subfamily)